MGSVLPKGGPASLLIGFIIWGGVMWCINECFAELVCYLPIPSPFVTLGSRWVDDALGFAMSWNFFIKEALLVPYEIVAFSVLLQYWTDAVPGAAMVVAISACYVVLHSIGIRYWGIAEMYMATFKIALMCGLILFTIITMSGGNPLHDAFGFRYWQDPGAFVEYKVAGGGGRFLGVLVGLLQAAFT
jgi:amino acid transporter